MVTSGNQSSSIWINSQRFGDIGGQRLGGFVGGAWRLDGNEVLAWGWSGGWRRWHCKSLEVGVNDEVWEEVGAIGGHLGPVKSVNWSPSGSFLISSGCVFPLFPLINPSQVCLESIKQPAFMVESRQLTGQHHGMNLPDRKSMDTTYLQLCF